jgi:electron transfer flavoprotein alpha/beta subunit
MKLLALVRLTFDPKEVAELTLASGAVQAGRISLAINEGDIKGIQLIKPLKKPFDAISIGQLDNTSRVHTFVRGADKIYEIGSILAGRYDEEDLASMLVSQIKSMGGVQIVVCSPIEQDSGRGLLPGVLAAKLGFELIVGAKSVTEKDNALIIEQVLEYGTQTIVAKGPVVLCPDESCELGDDPSDSFDLIEKLEKKESIKVNAEQLLGASKSSVEVKLEAPAAVTAQPVVTYSAEALKKILALVKPFSN